MKVLCPVSILFLITSNLPISLLNFVINQIGDLMLPFIGLKLQLINNPINETILG